jgi:hypothetical protein
MMSDYCAEWGLKRSEAAWGFGIEAEYLCDESMILI